MRKGDHSPLALLPPLHSQTDSVVIENDYLPAAHFVCIIIKFSPAGLLFFVYKYLY